MRQLQILNSFVIIDTIPKALLSAINKLQNQESIQQESL